MPATKTRVSAADVRDWAVSKRLDVAARGTLPTSIVQAYNKAHPRNKYVP